MKSLVPPEISAELSYRACISDFDDSLLRGRLAQITDEVIEASREFELAAMAGSFLAISEKVPKYEDYLVTKRQFANVYSVGMVRHPTGRALYDKIKGTGKCPSCQIRTISQLDHYMPKSAFPLLAVTPLNLVPTCSDCNFMKRAFKPQSASQVLLHPYFDDISRETWLTAELEEGDPPIFNYRADPPEAWPEELRARVIFQFEKLELAELYAIEATAELQEIRIYLSNLHGGHEDGQQAVRDHLQEVAHSRANVARNGWRAAAYTAMASSDWFCRTAYAS